MNTVADEIKNLNLVLLPLLPYLSRPLQEKITTTLSELQFAVKCTEDKNNILEQAIDRQDDDIQELNVEIDTLTTKLEQAREDFNPLLEILEDCYKFGYNPDRLEKINSEYRALCINVLQETI